ncbi:MAG: dihydropteroate synthase [Nitratireductor sp.]|nr:dihydropteroate synthase [Nitratireductor sp.]
MAFDPFRHFEWELAHGRSVTLGPRAVIMGVLNVTPDSFSDGGRYLDTEAAIRQAKRLHRAGAAIIDIGGESSRPGFEEIPASEEQARILPVFEALRDTGMILSVDTWRAETARAAIAAGAHIVNDIWGFQRDPELAGVAARSGAGCVLMHTGRGREKAGDVIADQIAYLSASLEVAGRAGIARQQIVLDPGYGFAKDPAENIAILARTRELFALGCHILTGTSRKRFIGHVTGRRAASRDVGTAATSVVARMQGSAVFRVHDVPKNRDALAIADAVLEARGKTLPDR